jgi:hypothetical protein
MQSRRTADAGALLASRDVLTPYNVDRDVDRLVTGLPESLGT